MGYDLLKPLVIGISSRALFDLERENAIFEREGKDAFCRYQIEHENEILQPGAAFPLVRAFLSLNERVKDRRAVEVILMSRNNADTSLRIFHSIQHYGLDIARSALVTGAELSPYLKVFHTDLFLSAFEQDVTDAVNNGVAAAIIYPSEGHDDPEKPVRQIRIAFDGDAVLFSAESEHIYKKEGLPAFQEHERQLAGAPMAEGPFANFLKTLAALQREFAGEEPEPIRTALVTSRSAPAHERAIRTLRAWNVRVDEVFFLGGVEKKEILSAFAPQIFFDDQDVHLEPASEVVPAARVPYRNGDEP